MSFLRANPYTGGMGREEPLASEQVIIEAPLSFTGSAKRIIPAVYGALPKRRWAVPVAPVVVVLVIAVIWAGVLLWYAVWNIFIIPFRLFRRLQLKSEVDEQRHRELLDAIHDANTARENPTANEDRRDS